MKNRLILVFVGLLISGCVIGSGAATNAERVDVTSFGTKGDGVTNDTAAIQQALATAYGKELFFPPGTYLVNEIALDAALDIVISGAGKKLTKLLPAANGQKIFSLSGTFANSIKLIRDLGFETNRKMGVTAIDAIKVRKFAVENVLFEFNLPATAIHVDRARGVSVRNVDTINEASFLFESTVVPADLLAELSIVDLHHATLTTRTSTTPYLRLVRVVNAELVNVRVDSLSGVANAVQMEDDCQGVFMVNSVLVWPAIGVKGQAVSGRLPKYFTFVSSSVDQPAVSGMDLEVKNAAIIGALLVNGAERNNTGSGLHIRGTSDNIFIETTHIRDNRNDGLVIDAGVAHKTIIGSRIESNVRGGTGFDVVMPSANPNTTRVSSSFFGTQNIVGQYINQQGNTSSTRHHVLTAKGTLASTAEMDLYTYVLPSPGGLVLDNCALKITAWGQFAANGNTKTVRLRFGSANFAGPTGTFNGVDWRGEWVIHRVSATLQKAYRTSWVSGNSPEVASNLGAGENLDAAVTIRLTGQNGTASANDIIVDGWTIEDAE